MEVGSTAALLIVLVVVVMLALIGDGVETDNLTLNGKQFLDDRKNESWDGHEANNLHLLLTENVGDKEEEEEEEKVDAII